MVQPMTIPAVEYYINLLRAFSNYDKSGNFNQNHLLTLQRKWKNPKTTRNSNGDSMIILEEDFDFQNSLHQTTGEILNQQEREEIIKRYNLEHLPTILEQQQPPILPSYDPPPSPPLQLSSPPSVLMNNNNNNQQSTSSSSSSTAAAATTAATNTTTTGTTSKKNTTTTTKRKRRSSSSSSTGGGGGRRKKPQRKRRNSSSSSSVGKKTTTKVAAASAAKRKPGRPRGSVNKIKMNNVSIEHPKKKGEKIAEMQCQISGDAKQRDLVRSVLKELGITKALEGASMGPDCSMTHLKTIYKR